MVNVEESDRDKWYVMPADSRGRLDMVALEVYGDESLWWVIADVNDIKDPFYGAVPGMILRMPPIDKVLGKIMEGE